MKKRRGHYCWSCDRFLASERFSGKGHARHLCRECSRLGPEELEYRSAVRAIGRCINWGGLIRRKQSTTFKSFLRHHNPRVRAFAREVENRDQQLRLEWRQAQAADEEEALALEEMAVGEPLAWFEVE